jgi:O-antigen biosynthesis protein
LAISQRSDGYATNPQQVSRRQVERHDARHATVRPSVRAPCSNCGGGVKAAVSAFRPVAVADLELSRPLALSPVPEDRYQEARVLVRLCGHPLGQISIDLADRSGSALARAAWGALGPEIRAASANQGLPVPSSLMACGLVRPHVEVAQPWASIAVVIATRNRTEVLRRCLMSIARQTVKPAQIIVVDNAPSDDQTESLLVGPFGIEYGIQYVREERPGLAIAHNAALPLLASVFAAFTDDDVVTDERWLEQLLRGFSAHCDVACVTGLIAPAELETREQLWTEDYIGFTKGYSPRLFDLTYNAVSSPLYPFAAGRLGSGANMAFRVDYLRRVGGFDGSLGTGTMSCGGDDLAAFHEVIMSGMKLAYEPGAIVRHFHNRTPAAIRRQMVGYGVGLTAYLTSVVSRRPSSVFTMIWRGPSMLWHMMRRSSRWAGGVPADYPGELLWAERLGMLRGPGAYARTRWERRGWSHSG